MQWSTHATVVVVMFGLTVVGAIVVVSAPFSRILQKIFNNCSKSYRIIQKLYLHLYSLWAGDLGYILN